ncbi:hypothetical protein BDW71DRAFT_100693 [Aspergillus fruticulosus]
MKNAWSWVKADPGNVTQEEWMGEAKVSAPLSRVRGIQLLVYFWLLSVSNILYDGVLTRVLLFFSTYSFFYPPTYSPYCFCFCFSSPCDNAEFWPPQSFSHLFQLLFLDTILLVAEASTPILP